MSAAISLPSSAMRSCKSWLLSSSVECTTAVTNAFPFPFPLPLPLLLLLPLLFVERARERTLLACPKDSSACTFVSGTPRCEASAAEKSAERNEEDVSSGVAKVTIVETSAQGCDPRGCPSSHRRSLSLTTTDTGLMPWPTKLCRFGRRASTSRLFPRTSTSVAERRLCRKSRETSQSLSSTSKVPSTVAMERRASKTRSGTSGKSMMPRLPVMRVQPSRASTSEGVDSTRPAHTREQASASFPAPAAPHADEHRVVVLLSPVCSKSGQELLHD